MTEAECFAVTVKAFKNATMMRAKAYAYIYDELLKQTGMKKADEIFSKAIYRLGADKTGNFTIKAKKSLKNLALEFIKDPVSRAVFRQNILSCTEDNLKIEMKSCPLVDMWKKMGLSKTRIQKLCDLAYQIDFGKIEGLGYGLKFNSRIACGNRSCVLDIIKK